MSSRGRTKGCVTNTKQIGDSLNKINHCVSEIVNVRTAITTATEEQNAAIS